MLLRWIKGKYIIYIRMFISGCCNS